jgi:hypothetical protein
MRGLLFFYSLLPTPYSLLATNQNLGLAIAAECASSPIVANAFEDGS